MEISQAYQKHDYAQGHRIPQFVVHEHQAQ
jgi:NTE family protein